MSNTQIAAAIGAPAAAPAGAELDAATVAHLATSTGDRSVRVAHNAVTRVGADEAALDRRRMQALDHSFSVVLDDWKVTNQRASGRCWMFAALNLMRSQATKRFKRKDFEFSQSYLQFWDKLERANYVLNALAGMADAPGDDRRLQFLLERAMEDGGQWNMLAALVTKHGLLPKQVMPETFSSSNTRRLNSVLRTLVRRAATQMRAVVAEQAGSGSNGHRHAALAEVRERTLADIYRVLAVDLGEPPASFLWQWNDDDREFHREAEMTPQQFAEQNAGIAVEDYVCVVHDPRPEHPVARTYTVDLLGNVVGAPPVVYLNVEIQQLKAMARTTIEDGEPVWFGCDSGKHMQRKAGVWDDRLYDYESLYGVSFDLTKAERLHTRESAMTHAMLLTGVDVLDDNVRRWRCENSWGDEAGKQGFFAISDEWFDQYVFEIAVHRERLPADLLAALQTEPIILPPWDPMGSLAG